MFKQLILVIGAISIAACSSLKVREKDDNAVGTIKKVAVVAFSEIQPASAHIGLNLSKGKLQGEKGGSLIPQNGPHVDSMYTDLANQLQNNMSWTVIDQKKMMSNAGYTKAYKQTMEGWQSKMPPPQGENQFLVKGIMDSDSLRILGPEGRDALIDSLGVDAIVVSRVSVILKGTTVMGIGSHHPQSRLSFEVFIKGHEKAVWFDGNIEGDESEESVGKTGFIDETLLSSLAEKSAKSAFIKIGKN